MLHTHGTPGLIILIITIKTFDNRWNLPITASTLRLAYLLRILDFMAAYTWIDIDRLA